MSGERWLKKSGLSILLTVFFVLPMLILTKTFVQAQAYPVRPIKMIVTYGAGGATDLMARGISKATEKILGQPIIVENNPAGGNLAGLSVLEKSKADGYTLAAIPTSAFAWSPHLVKIAYDPFKSFTLISQICSYTLLVCGKADGPFKNAKQLIEYSRTQPNLKFSTPSTNTMHDVVQYVVAKKAGVIWRHVPYKSGMEAITALLGGHVSFCVTNQEQVPFIMSGQLIPLATHSDRRNTYFPDLPTWRDLGYPVGAETRVGIAGPPGMPKPIVDALSEALKKAVDDPEYVELSKNLKAEKLYVGPEEFLKFNRDQYERTGTMLKELGIPIVVQ